MTEMGPSEIFPVLQSFLSGVHTVYETCSRYKAKRTQHRVEQVHTYLRKGVTNLEKRVLQLEQHPPDADLFLATLHSLMQDDEDQKTDFYAAFLEHLLNNERTDREMLRMIAVSFKSLNSAELRCLADAREDGALPELSADWVEASLQRRLQFFGLYKPTEHVVKQSHFTSLGFLARSIATKGLEAQQPTAQ